MLPDQVIDYTHGRRGTFFEGAELSFEDVRIPKENLLGEEGAAFGYLRTNLAQERLSIAVGSVATSRRALDLVTKHAEDRKTFGSRLVDHQAYRWELAKMATSIQAAQSFVDQAIMEKVRGTLDEVTGAMAKYHTTELQRFAAGGRLLPYIGLSEPLL